MIFQEILFWQWTVGDYFQTRSCPERRGLDLNLVAAVGYCIFLSYGCNLSSFSFTYQSIFIYSLQWLPPTVLFALHRAAVAQNSFFLGILWCIGLCLCPYNAYDNSMLLVDILPDWLSYEETSNHCKQITSAWRAWKINVLGGGREFAR